MICEECGAFFIRYPCPTCGKNDKSKIIRTRSLETSSNMMIQEERLLKPSELKDKLNKEKENQNQPLLKPSELNPDRLIDPQNPFGEHEDALLKPSQLKGRSAVNPKFNLKSSIPHVSIVSAKHGIKPVRETISNISREKKDGETDEEYKQRVHDTLVEVMSLLEKLME